MKKFSRILIYAVITSMLLSCIDFNALVYAAEMSWPKDYGLLGKEMPFRPADKYVTEQNPPDFSWPKVKGANTYDLKICRDAQMKDVAYEKKGVATNFYNFDCTFDIGTYYWSVRFLSGSSASEWSDIRRFRIDPDACEFKVESLDKLIERVPKSHPRIWATQDTVEQFRARKDGPAKAYYEQALSSVKTAMEKPFPSEPTYTSSGNLVTDALALSNLRWAADALINPMFQSAFVYFVSQDKEIGRYSISALLELSKWDPNGATSYKTQDQIHRVIAYKAAMAYDWLYDIMTEDERQTVLNMIKVRTEVMTSDLLQSIPIPEMPFESHGWTAFGYVGIIAIATFDDIPEAKGWLEYILPTYINRLAPWSSEDGGWSQGTDYWQYSSPAAKEFQNVLLNAGIINLYDKAYSKNEMLFPIYMFPKGSIGAFGDQSYSAPTSFSIAILNRLASVYKSPVAKWARDQIGKVNYSDLQGYFETDVDDVNAQLPVNWSRSRFFKDIGWAALHSDLADPNRVTMFFKSSWFGSFNHSHPDQNSFIIQAYGEPLAIDSGYYDAYHSNFDVNYTRKTYAHNAITIDGGSGQADDSIDAKGVFKEFISHTDFDLVSGDSTRAYNGKLNKAKRHIIFVRPDAFVVIDDLEANKSEGSVFEWWLNGQEDISLYESNKGARVVKGEAVLDAKVQYPEKVKGYYSNLFSGPDLVHIKPEGNYANSTIQKRVWFETEKVKQTKMVTTLDVHRKSEQAQYIKTKNYDNYIELQFDDGTRVLVKTSNDETITAGDITFSGDAVVINDNSVMLVSGTKLEIGGKVVVEAQSEMTVVTGKDEIGVSTFDDSSVKVYSPNFKSITDNKKRAVDSKIGATFEQKDDILEFKLDKGNYSFYLNDKPMPGEKGEDIIVKLNIDGVESEVSLGSYYDLNGELKALGNLVNQGGIYKIISKSKGLNIKDAAVGQKISIIENELVSCVGQEQYLTLSQIKVVPCEAVLIDDHEAAKGTLAIFKEAEDFTSMKGGGNVYATREFMSGGAGITKMNGADDKVTYTIDVKEAGYYDFVIKHVAWMKDVETIRTLNIGDYYASFVCPLTEGWGAAPEDWKAMRIKTNIYLEAGENTVTLGCKGDGQWNLDWIGLVKN